MLFGMLIVEVVFFLLGICCVMLCNFFRVVGLILGIVSYWELEMLVILWIVGYWFWNFVRMVFWICLEYFLIGNGLFKFILCFCIFISEILFIKKVIFKIWLCWIFMCIG